MRKASAYAWSSSTRHGGSQAVFRDPVFDGAADPVVIWNRQERIWFLFYTDRRASETDLPGVSWVYGSLIGIAESRDGGAIWRYHGTAQINHGDGEPTYWAPNVLYHNGSYHMFLTFVPEVRTDWSGTRSIVHLSSSALLQWDYHSTLSLASDKVIDASVLRLPNGSWRLYYNNEVDGKSIYYADSPDLFSWQDGGKLVSDRSGEGPKVFFWQDRYWMIVDQWRGLGVYHSPNALHWTPQEQRLLDTPGQGIDDQVIGQHADVERGSCKMLVVAPHKHLVLVAVGVLEASSR